MGNHIDHQFRKTHLVCVIALILNIKRALGIFAHQQRCGATIKRAQMHFCDPLKRLGSLVPMTKSTD